MPTLNTCPGYSLWALLARAIDISPSYTGFIFEPISILSSFLFNFSYYSFLRYSYLLYISIIRYVYINISSRFCLILYRGGFDTRSLL